MKYQAVKWARCVLVGGVLICGASIGLGQDQKNSSNPHALIQPALHSYRKTFDDPDPNAPSTNQPTQTAQQPEKEEDPEAFGRYILEAIDLEDVCKNEEAVEVYSKALAIDAESPVALVRRGVCYAHLGQNDKAAADLFAATGARVRPRTVTDFATLAWLRATSPISRFRDGSLAVSYAQRALTGSETAENYDVLAAAYAEMGDFQKAHDTMEKGLKFYPNSPRAAAMRARLAIYNKRKKYREDWSPVNKDSKGKTLQKIVDQS